MKYIVLIPALFLLLRANGQGCSDAGVCTAGPIGSLSPSDTSATDRPHSARMTFSYGIGERGVVVLQAIPQIDIRLSDRLSLQARIPWMRTTGDLGSNSGIGDPLITASFIVHRTDGSRLVATLGIKLPANVANAMFDGKPLPMPYQTSLGTTDLLVGATYTTGRWQGSLAYQHVLHQRNRNGFHHDIWMDDMKALGYFESLHLQRADDAIARIQYKFPVGKITLQPGLLGIHHLGNDRISNTSMDPLSTTISPEYIDVEGSEGLTLNMTIDARYSLTDDWALLLAFGSPVITREVRPDGLTRAAVLNVSLVRAFGR